VVQEYLTSRGLHAPEATYPLHLCLCTKCGLLQLDYIVPPELVFPKNYPYRTGLTNMLVRNFLSLRDTLMRKGLVKTGELIIDIGSNDGTLLKGFKEAGMRVLGVEPTDSAKAANKAGIPTIQEFLGGKTVANIVKRHGRAKIITATNVFAHINNAPELMKNIKALMDDDAVFVSESQYLMDIVEKLEFDTVYHEHLRFYSLKPLIYFMKSAGCTLFDAERIGAAGGSIRAYAKKGTHSRSKGMKELLAEETRAGLHDVNTLRKFADRVTGVKHELLALLLACRKKGRIAAIGSPARSNTLLGFCRIDEQLIEYAGEKAGSPKIGLYTPGMHIPVVLEDKLLKEQPPYCLILSWHIGNELVDILRKRGYKGKCIIPLPHPRVVER